MNCPPVGVFDRPPGKLKSVVRDSAWASVLILVGSYLYICVKVNKYLKTYIYM